MSARDYGSCRVELDGQVATVTLVPPERRTEGARDLHWDLGELFGELRGDNSCRVVVLTGMDGKFFVAPSKEFFRTQTAKDYLSEPAGAYRTFTGVLRTHQTMAEIEKPIVAKVNGDAIGFGASLVFACDIIVAAEDAVFSDIHLGMGEVEEGGPEYGIVPGDGGGALVPLFMSPVKAKEYMMLSLRRTGAELAREGVINHAVPAAEVDGVVADIVARLLRRPAYALAWTKRIMNRRVVDQLNMTLDASAAYEMVNFLQLERSGWVDPVALE